MRGALTAALALVVLEVLVTNKRGAGTVSGLLGWFASGVNRILDPNVPAFGAQPAPPPSSTSPSSPKAAPPPQQGPPAYVPTT